MVRETPTGGTVSYPFQTEGDRLSSPGRSQALSLIAEKCRGKSRIVREGEIPRVRAEVDRAWRGQMSGDRLWALQFTCD